jgi:hypothetical protein
MSSTAGTGASDELAASLTSSSNLPVLGGIEFGLTSFWRWATLLKVQSSQAHHFTCEQRRTCNSHRIHNVVQKSPNIRAFP